MDNALTEKGSWYTEKLTLTSEGRAWPTGIKHQKQQMDKLRARWGLPAKYTSVPALQGFPCGTCQLPAPQGKSKPQLLAATILRLKNNTEILLHPFSVLHQAHGYQGDTASPQPGL